MLRQWCLKKKNHKAFSALCALNSFVTIYSIYSCKLNPKEREKGRKGTERQRKTEKEANTQTKESESNNGKTILNICEATPHYSPLISSSAPPFIHQNYFTNDSAIPQALSLLKHNLAALNGHCFTSEWCVPSRRGLGGPGFYYHVHFYIPPPCSSIPPPPPQQPLGVSHGRSISHCAGRL